MTEQSLTSNERTTVGSDSGPLTDRSLTRWLLCRLLSRRPDLGVLLLILVSYIPLLLTKPGKVGADTKTYLYLDPGRLLSRAPFMWDPNIGTGTVTHQNIGYLWPMGPYYFVMDAIGLPDWVAQRLWLGSIILAAGLGVRWMLKEIRWEGAGTTVAGVRLRIESVPPRLRRTNLGDPVAFCGAPLANRSGRQIAAAPGLEDTGDLCPGHPDCGRSKRHEPVVGDGGTDALVPSRRPSSCARFPSPTRSGPLLRITVLTAVT